MKIFRSITREAENLGKHIKQETNNAANHVEQEGKHAIKHVKQEVRNAHAIETVGAILITLAGAAASIIECENRNNNGTNSTNSTYRNSTAKNNFKSVGHRDAFERV